ncbi:HD-GYP domain-containing protein [Roseateles saccharophilus]|uniref:HD-GYP domain-containing protein n=1 Tax=Roseateles saccharophilus TaxID=304 RepID=UPI00104FD9C1|nr:hypothetical protein [Roseateles saccharophilus]MDG0835857.1 hypothetical protein [Roseateles saccharophilus]
MPADAIEGWDQIKRQMTSLLRRTDPDAAWIGQFDQATQRMQALARRNPDAALYLLLQAAANEVDRYSAHHAMLCALVCELCAAWFEWPDDEVRTLVRAALTMNLSMSATQDALAQQLSPLSEAQRQEIEAHAANSSLLLAAASVADPLWLDVVRQHHDAPHASGETAPPPAERLAQLLHRVDVYTAKLSRRASREPTSPAIAARDACLDAAGLPDAIGATMLRVLGLYPPGCFVRLASEETGVVVRRGSKAHTPIVASLRRSDGGLYLQPVRRDTTSRQHAVVRGVGINEVKVRLHHERVLSVA